MASLYHSVFHIDVDKVKPNPFQPRHQFDEAKLRDLADSIRQYGVLQPLVVTRKEIELPEGGLSTEYELIAGERRLRAARIAGLAQVPVVIRDSVDDDKMKLELAIIENLQREDLNPIDRAVAFKRLADEFGFKHTEIAKKIGKSREYVSNTIRLLALPPDMQRAILDGVITEGHSRPLLMLSDRPEEQLTLYKEITTKKMAVREAEGIARRIAFDRARKMIDPEWVEMEMKLTEILGTRVRIDRKDVGGKILIDFFSEDDIRKLLAIVAVGGGGTSVMHTPIPEPPAQADLGEQVRLISTPADGLNQSDIGNGTDTPVPREEVQAPTHMTEQKTPEPEDLYSIKNFSV
ncbi:MAG: ParB/RepB/Spo0J family partition protein [Patescibacteria group bacterium]